MFKECVPVRHKNDIKANVTQSSVQEVFILIEFHYRNFHQLQMVQITLAKVTTCRVTPKIIKLGL